MLSEQQFPQQLRMFMTPGEIKSSVYPIDSLGGSPDKLWKRKLSEAHSDGLADDIRRNGVQMPVHLAHEPSTSHNVGGKPELVGGHHRVATADAVAPDSLVPVVHDPTYWDAITSPYYRHTQ